MSVVWGDMDAYQHLNNTVYFRYFESVRVELLRESGFIESMEQDGIGAILRDTRCRFRAPVTYPDRVHVAGRVREIGEDRFVMDYAIWSEKLATLAAEGDGTIVCLDYRAAAKAPIPDSIRARLEGYR
ncbi:hypothetical protein ABI59_18505 [Acidobacteria bacterium Mor1]|nr:hypothetical protein ABI59_18505 [Acidobacteria bacterium Mor1]